MNTIGIQRRHYEYCARCGQPKWADSHYVCKPCWASSTPSYFRHCAVCGKAFANPDGLAYVCGPDLVRPVPNNGVA